VSELARHFALRAIAPEIASEVSEATTPHAEFDASRVFDAEPVDQHKLYNSIRVCGGDVVALGILLDQSKQELQASIYYCNQKAWGYWDTEVGPPTPGQAAALVERMDTRFTQHARAARYLHALCGAASEALDKAKAGLFQQLTS
jgi:hypothetical protein